MTDAAAYPLPDTGPETLQTFFAQEYPRLCAAAMQMLSDPHLAQDAVQNAWLRLSDPRVQENLDLCDADKLRHLALVAVRHAAVDLWRRERRFRPLPPEHWRDQPDPAATAAEQAEAHAAAAALRRAMAGLDELDANILTLQYADGCTSRQIAALLGLREAAVRQRAHRARKCLKKILIQEGWL